MSSILNTIKVAKVTSALASASLSKAKIFDRSLIYDERYPKMITTERIIIEKLYNGGYADPTLQICSDYLYDLCGPFLPQAQSIVDNSSGGSVVPITPTQGFFFDYLIEVNGGVPDFANATDYNDTRIIGRNLVIFWNDVPTFLISGEWAYTSTGIRILVGGFDASINNYDFKIFIKDPFGASGTSTSEVTRSFQYTGTGSETSFFESLLVDSTIITVARGTDYQLINSGTPTGLQALVTLNGTLSDGNIAFASDNPIGAGEIVTIVFSKSSGG